MPGEFVGQTAENRVAYHIGREEGVVKALEWLAAIGASRVYDRAIPVEGDKDGANQNVLDALPLMFEWVNNHDKLAVVTGPMASGKSTLLVKLTRELIMEGWPVVYYKHEFDEQRVASHERRRVKIQAGANGIATEIEAVLYHDLTEVTRGATKENGISNGVIILDEFMFSGLGSVPRESAENMDEFLRIAYGGGNKVIIGGLHSDFRGSFWPNMLQAIPLADLIVEFRGRCDKAGCQKPSMMTQRNVPLVDEKGQIVAIRPSHLGEKIVRVGSVLGHGDDYRARCPEHHQVWTHQEAQGYDEKFGFNLGDYGIST
jgi:thymidine kinase